MTPPTSDLTTIQATRAFYDGLARSCHTDVEQIEVALAHLAELELDEQTLDGFQSAQEDAARAAARCRSTVAVLDARQALLEQAVNATPDAAKTEYYQDGPSRDRALAGIGATTMSTAALPARGAALGGNRVQLGDRSPATGLATQGADPYDVFGAEETETPPLWPGHVPRRRWEWKVVGHRPGDARHVQYALPSVDLSTEQAVHEYVQKALAQHDWIEILHWYSGTELTFTRRPSGSIHIDRRQLRPADGSPLRAAYDAANPWTQGR
ncbi:MAG TPA: hypothetical protein VJT31_22220 [Rugosimonospora sp.]|nr:hypothetical protein [Rugosimonospora sp.]